MKIKIDYDHYKKTGDKFQKVELRDFNYSSKGLFIKIKLVALKQEILGNDIVYNDDFTICEHIEFIECKKHDTLYYIHMFGQNIIYDGFRQRAYFNHSYINI